MNKNPNFKVGTLIEDNGKIAIIYRMIEHGNLKGNTIFEIIKSRLNYEIYYLDGSTTLMGDGTLNRLIKNKQIKLIADDTVLNKKIKTEMLNELSKK